MSGSDSSVTLAGQLGPFGQGLELGLGHGAAHGRQAAVGASNEAVLGHKLQGAANGVGDVFGRLDGLQKLQIFNCREFDDALVQRLKGLAALKVLAVTNSGITDAAVETIAASFPGLIELDLSSNTNLTGAAMKSIATIGGLERLSLVQTRFNDLNTRRLSKLTELKALDLRGNMEAGDMTLGVVGGLPKLKALKHRSTVVNG